MRNLEFDPQAQVYKFDDVEIPRVTQITRAVCGKSYEGVPLNVLDAARARGLSIHEDVAKETFATSEGQWIEEQIGDAVLVHGRLGTAEIDGLVFAGTPDLVAGKTLVDIKSESTRDILYWTIQLNLYNEMVSSEIDRLQVYWTPKSGNYQIVPIQFLSNSQLSEVISAFRENRILPLGWLDGPRPENLSLDLVVYEHNVGTLTTNARAILELVEKKLEGYRAENYSEKNIAQAKRDKADLNNAAKKLNDKRLELEREFMRPFKEFKDTVQATCAKIKTASCQIDTIVREIDNRERLARKNLLEEKWQELGCKLFPLSSIWDERWLNKTFKAADAVEIMCSEIARVGRELETLDKIDMPEVKAFYLATLDLSAAMLEADRTKANRERLAEQARIVEQKTEKAPEPLTTESIPIQIQPAIKEKTIRIRCSENLFTQIKEWFVAMEIEFEVLQGEQHG